MGGCRFGAAPLPQCRPFQTKRPTVLPLGGVGNPAQASKAPSLPQKTAVLLLSPESMILLGSIERTQIVALLSEQLSYLRRLQYMREKTQAERRAAEKSQEDEEHQTSDTGVRFQVPGVGPGLFVLVEELPVHLSRAEAKANAQGRLV